MVKIAVFASLIVSAILLTSCSSPNNNTAETNSNIANSENIVSNSDDETNYKQDSSEGANIPSEIPTQHSVEEDYKRAFDSFWWFYGGSLVEGSEDMEDQKIELDGVVYYPVNNEKFKTYNDLKNYLLSIFTEDVVTNKLLNKNVTNTTYRDIDGKLYGTFGARGSDITIGNETYSLIKNNNASYTFIVTAEHLKEDLKTVDHTQDYKFNYEYVNGNWVFSDFYLFR